MVIIARKKPIEVWAARYIDAKIVLDEFLKLLSSNKDEPIRYDGTDDTIYIQKECGEIALPKGNWVISEVNTDNCFWSIDHDIFLKTYTRVSGNVYKKKVYDVECIELESLEAKDICSVLEFIGYRTNGDVLKVLQMDEIIEDCQLKGYVPINTLEGVEALYPTEVLIKGVEGEFYPIKRENFDKVYDILREG